MSISWICDPPEMAAKIRLRANNRWDVLLGSRDLPRFPAQLISPRGELESFIFDKGIESVEEVSLNSPVLA